MKFGVCKYLVVSIILLISLASYQSVCALDKSRAFTFLLFISGIGSNVAGAFLQAQANETYDKYLHTASQAEIESLTRDYENKHSQSLIASRTGLGMTIGAILISLIDAANIPPPEEQKTPSIFGFGFKTFDARFANIHAQDGELALAIVRRF